MIQLFAVESSKVKRLSNAFCMVGPGRRLHVLHSIVPFDQQVSKTVRSIV